MELALFYGEFYKKAMKYEAIYKNLHQAMYDLTHALSIVNSPSQSVQVEAIESLSNAAKEILLSIDKLGELWDIDTSFTTANFGFDINKIPQVVEEYREYTEETKKTKIGKA